MEPTPQRKDCATLAERTADRAKRINSLGYSQAALFTAALAVEPYEIDKPLLTHAYQVWCWPLGYWPAEDRPDVHQAHYHATNLLARSAGHIGLNSAAVHAAGAILRELQSDRLNGRGSNLMWPNPIKGARHVMTDCQQQIVDNGHLVLLCMAEKLNLRIDAQLEWAIVCRGIRDLPDEAEEHVAIYLSTPTATPSPVAPDPERKDLAADVDAGEVSEPMPNTSDIAKAIAVLHNHPDWTNRQIADEVGCNVKYLSQRKGREPNDFQKARSVIKALGKETHHRSPKSRGKGVDDYGDDEG